MTLPDKTERRAIVDTHRHPIGPKLAAKMAESGLYDPKQAFPQTNDKDLICYREFFDLDYAMPKQREGGVTLSLASNGGEVEWFARDLLQVSTGDALKILNDEYLEIIKLRPTMVTGNLSRMSGSQRETDYRIHAPSNSFVRSDTILPPGSHYRTLWHVARGSLSATSEEYWLDIDAAGRED